MTRPPDPEHGELHLLADSLSAPKAEMLTEDLRDLQIPVTVEPDAAQDTFAVFVPAAFVAIAQRVLSAWR